MNEKWKAENYFVSPSNFEDKATRDFRFSESLEIHDVTLRDGEQQPGVAFTKQDKIEIAKMLSEIGVHRIEAGMPAVSQSDYEAIGEIAKLGLSSKIFVFSRAMEEDIQNAVDLGVNGVVVEIPANEELILHGYNWPTDRPIKAACEACRLAHENGLFVNLFLMDSSRLSVDRFVEMVKEVKKNSWIDSCTIVDTQGVLSFPGARYMISEAVKALGIPVEAHFHNDIGCGTANALAAFEAGASALHTTVLGIGPRAGQAATEQVALALKLHYGYDSGIKLDSLYSLDKRVAELALIKAPGNQPVAGDLIYQIEAGMPAAWWPRVEKEHPLSLYGILPEVIGQPPVEIVLGKGSGAPSISYWLDKLNLKLKDENDTAQILQDVKNKGLAEKRPLTQAEFKEIVKDYI